MSESNHGPKPATAIVRPVILREREVELCSGGTTFVRMDG